MVHELGYRDKVIIPDQYNTGLTNPDALVKAVDVLSNWAKKSEINKTVLDNYGSYTLENIWFETLFGINPDNITQPIVFKNCKFGKNVRVGQNYAFQLASKKTWTINNSLVFDHCEFSGFDSCAFPQFDRTVVRNSQIHFMGKDGAKAGSYGGFENCYFYDLGLGNTWGLTDVHADGIQFTTGITEFYVKNCRFDMPATSQAVSNAGIMLKMESGDADNVVLQDILIDGGNYCVYVMVKDGTAYEITDLFGSDIKLGYNINHGLYYCNVSDYENWISNGTIAQLEKIVVSSVFKGINGKIKVHATNYTLSDRTMVLVTDKETKSVTVPHCFSYADSQNKVFSDFPYNTEFECDGDYVICYDTSVASENEVRFQYCSVNKLFSDIADTIRSKTGGSNEIYRCNLPKVIDGLDVPAELGTKNITANGTYAALSDELDGYSSVTVSVSSTPEYMVIITDTLAENTETYEIPYDSTKTVMSVVQYMTDAAAGSTTTTGCYARKNINNSNYNWSISTTDGNGNESASSSNMSLTFDDTNNKIIFATRSGRPWRSGKTYRTILTYAETT